MELDRVCWAREEDRRLRFEWRSRGDGSMLVGTLTALLICWLCWLLFLRKNLLGSLDSLDSLSSSFFHEI